MRVTEIICVIRTKICISSLSIGLQKKNHEPVLLITSLVPFTNLSVDTIKSTCFDTPEDNGNLSKGFPRNHFYTFNFTYMLIYIIRFFFILLNGISFNRLNNPCNQTCLFHESYYNFENTEKKHPFYKAKNRIKYSRSYKLK